MNNLKVSGYRLKNCANHQVMPLLIQVKKNLVLKLFNPKFWEWNPINMNSFHGIKNK